MRAMVVAPAFPSDGSIFRDRSPASSSSPGQGVATRAEAVLARCTTSVRGASCGALRRRPVAEIEQSLAQLDQRIVHAAQADDSRFRSLADHGARLMEGLQAMMAAREVGEERRQKGLQMMESNMQLDLKNAQQARRETECRAEEVALNRVSELRDEFRRERISRETVQEEHLREIRQEVKRLSAILEEQRASRMEYGERITASLENEFEKVREAVIAEQKLRFEAEGTMLRMVEDVCTRMQAEISNERAEREAVQSKLLGLLEETCARIEATVGKARVRQEQIVL